MTKILIIEDELSIVKMLTYDLKQVGYNVDSALDGRVGLHKALKEDYDLILLDVMLPSMNGMEVCKQLRANNHQAYIIMLTAMDDEMHTIEGFDVGADDYVKKPFSPRELTARIKAGLRRQDKKETSETVVYKDITLDTSSYDVYKHGVKLSLTLKEFELLEYLIRHKGKALSREQLLTKLWGYSYDGDTRVVDVHIFKLRDKVDPDQTYIKTVRGIGYKCVE